MWKFKTSKYKNAAAKIPKKEEWITGISASNLALSFGNHIQASAAYVVFNQDIAGGSSLGILPVNGEQKRFTSGTLPTIQAHSDYVTDMEFSPFDDFLLATASQDNLVKLWSLPESLDTYSSPICVPLCTLTMQTARVEVVRWNPVIENVLGVTTGSALKLYDTATQKVLCDMTTIHTDQIQSISWSDSGPLLTSTCKDKKLRVIDARAGAVTQTVDSHSGIRESRCLWLGCGKDFILTTGVNSTRQRELILRDTRNLSQSLKTISFDNSTGAQIPLYDTDTGMLFIAGKGDVSIRYLEVSDKDPYLTENSTEMVEQMKGACLLPKRAVDVMSCEVNRIYILTQSSILPIPFIVPRKAVRDYQSDLYPDTGAGVPLMDCEQWINSTVTDYANMQIKKISLDPAAKCQLLLHGPARRTTSAAPNVASTVPATPGDAAADVANPAAAAADSTAATADASATAVSASTDTAEAAVSSAGSSVAASAAAAISDTAVARAVTQKDKNKSGDTNGTSKDIEQDKPVKEISTKSAAVSTGMNQSKYRHIEGVVLHKTQRIDNVRNISRTVPGESDLFHANSTYCAVPLGGAGGLIAVLRIDRAGRLPDSNLPTVQNSSAVSDFTWDPFNDHRLVVGCEDAKIRVWKIPSEDFAETLCETEFSLIGHSEKLYFVRFHPTAKDILASGSYDMTVRIWNLETQQQCIVLNGHSDTIFSFSWSSTGKHCATSSKDGQIRIYEPRVSSEPSITGKALEGSRGGRLVWACNDRILVVTGFDRASVRQIAVYKIESDTISQVYRIDLDTAPAILVPHYDPDTSVIFLTGRGDGLIRMFEVTQHSPYLLPLTDYSTDGLHQSLSYLPKRLVDVREVEICRVLRLTMSSIEPLSFRVPRVKKDYFQDDIYKDTVVSWEAAVSASDWLNGKEGVVKTISLKPADMISLSEAPVEAAKPRKYESFHDYSNKYKTDEQKKEELISAMTNKLNLDEGPLPQDLTEGVDPDEWDD